MPDQSKLSEDRWNINTINQVEDMEWERTTAFPTQNPLVSLPEGEKTVTEGEKTVTEEEKTVTEEEKMVTEEEKTVLKRKRRLVKGCLTLRSPNPPLPEMRNYFSNVMMSCGNQSVTSYTNTKMMMTLKINFINF